MKTINTVSGQPIPPDVRQEISAAIQELINGVELRTDQLGILQTHRNHVVKLTQQILTSAGLQQEELPEQGNAEPAIDEYDDNYHQVSLESKRTLDVIIRSMMHIPGGSIEDKILRLHKNDIIGLVKRLMIAGEIRIDDIPEIKDVDHSSSSIVLARDYVIEQIYPVFKHIIMGGAITQEHNFYFVVNRKYVIEFIRNILMGARIKTEELDTIANYNVIPGKPEDFTGRPGEIHLIG